MLQIGVCDDDSRMASVYAQAAEESLRQCGAVGRVLSYTDSRNLLWDITEDGFFFDLLLLDIEMPGVTDCFIKSSLAISNLDFLPFLSLQTHSF